MNRVAIIHNNRLLRESLGLAVAQEQNNEVVGMFDDVCAILNVCGTLEPNVIVIDFGLPERSGLGVARQLQSVRPAQHVLMIGVPNLESDIIDSIEAGAAGYLLCGASLRDLLESVRTVSTGAATCSAKIAGILFSRLAKGARERQRLRSMEMAHLTPREMEVISLIDSGLGNKEIAIRLGIEVQTVKNHVHNILDKLHVQGRKEAARYARETGLLSTFTERVPVEEF